MGAWPRAVLAGGGPGGPRMLCRGSAVGIEAAEGMNRNGDVPEEMRGFCALHGAGSVDKSSCQGDILGTRAQGGGSLRPFIAMGGVRSSMRSGVC